jgi:hypothetical protein
MKQAMKCVRWYCLRWRIEEWHRVLKSGCGVLEHQLGMRSASIACTKKKPISLGEAIVIIAKLGGYLNRRCDGPPGFQSLWRGYVRFHDMVYALMLREDAA